MTRPGHIVSRKAAFLKRTLAAKSNEKFSVDLRNIIHFTALIVNETVALSNQRHMNLICFAISSPCHE